MPCAKRLRGCGRFGWLATPPILTIPRSRGRPSKRARRKFKDKLRPTGGNRCRCWAVAASPRSNRDRGGVVVIEPLHSLPQADLPVDHDRDVPIAEVVASLSIGAYRRPGLDLSIVATCSAQLRGERGSSEPPLAGELPCHLPAIH